MRSKIWLLLLIAASIVGGWYGAHYYRHRFVRSNDDLVKLLPPGDLTIFFADLGVIRKAGMLRLLADVKPASDKEYDQFMQETQFDFARDLDSLAGGYDGTHLYFLGRGHFNWEKLQTYAVAHGGSCRGDFCQAPGSTPGKWADFLRVQPDVVGLSVSSDQDGADALRPPARRIQTDVPQAPVWLRMSQALRTNPTPLPPAAQIFAISVQAARGVVLSARPRGDGGLEIRLDAEFPNAAAADTARAQLAMQTSRLKAALAQDGQKAEPSNLAGLLTAGWFRSTDKQLVGAWPVQKELLASFQ